MVWQSIVWGFPSYSAVKNPPAVWEMQFDPWVRKIPWRRAWQPTPVSLSGKSNGPRSLVGYSQTWLSMSMHLLCEYTYSLFFCWTVRLSHWRFLNILVHIGTHFCRSEMAESWNRYMFRFWDMAQRFYKVVDQFTPPTAAYESCG